MAVEKTDLTIVNRNNKNYSATIREVSPPISDLDMLPGPPVIAIGGAPQMNPEPGDLVEIFREGLGELPRTNQWQRNGADIVGETGDTYTIVAEDLDKSVSLKQTFNDGEEQGSNEIEVPKPPMPWDDQIGQYHIIVRTGAKAPGPGNGNRLWMLFDGGTYAEIDAGQWTSFVQGSSDPSGDREYMITGESVAWFGTAATSIHGDVDFGPLTDTTGVTNMSRMFDTCKSFTGDVSMFDVSQVNNMDYMFHECWYFNQDLSGWCVEQFDSEPDNFHKSQVSNWQTSYKPQWGQPC